jgi:hypothetical protein
MSESLSPKPDGAAAVPVPETKAAPAKKSASKPDVSGVCKQLQLGQASAARCSPGKSGSGEDDYGRLPPSHVQR